MKKMALLVLSALALIPGQAFAYDWSTVAKVTSIEGTYMPDHITLTIDQTVGTCPAGGLLVWIPSSSDPTARAQNAQAILALLMTAEASGRTITVYGDNNGCAAHFLYLN